MTNVEQKLAALDAARGPLWRDKALCAWCGEITDREECTHCGNDPEGGPEPCGDCGGTGVTETTRSARGWYESPDDCVARREPCGKCGGTGEVSGGFVRESQEYAKGFVFGVSGAKGWEASPDSSKAFRRGVDSGRSQRLAAFDPAGFAEVLA